MPISGLTPEPSDARRAARLQRLAREAQGRRDWPTALARWEACLGLFPADPAAIDWRAARGKALLELGRLGEAEEAFLALDREHPSAARGLAGLARVAQSRGDARAAIERWKACIERFPAHPDRISWRMSQARLLEREEAWQQASSAWDDLARELGNEAPVQLGRARALLGWRGPTDEVERQVAAILEAHPDDLAALRLHAQLAVQRGEPETALERHRRCLERHPDDVESYQHAMDEALQLGEVAAAEEVLAQAPPEIAASAGFLCRVRLSYLMLRGDMAAGLALIAGLEEKALDQPSAAAVGRFLRDAVHYEELLGFARRMRERFPKSPIFAGLWLLALNHVRGRAAFEGEKKGLLQRLGNREAARVLEILPPSWLSVAEAKRVIDDRLARLRAPALKTHALLHLAARGDHEIRAYVADRLRALDGPAAAYLARSLLASIADRRRIASVGPGGCRWSDFTAAGEALWRDVDALLAANPTTTMRREAAEAVGAVRRAARLCKAAWVHSGDSYGDAVSVTRWLADRVRRAEPTSLLRLNDGEGAFLPYPPQYRKFQAGDRRIFQRIWWGEERIAGPPGDRLAGRYLAALYRADAIGVPTPRWLIAHLGVAAVRHTARGLIGAVGFVEGLPAETLREKILLSSHVHTDLEQWDLYRQILRAGSSVSVVSCHDLAPMMAERFGVALRCSLRIPPEYKYAGMFGGDGNAGGEPFYPDAFERIMAAAAPVPGEVFLVAAGFLGKLICDRVRQRGGIGIDIGGVADLWLGYPTRWVTRDNVDFDVANSLIEGQPSEEGRSGRQTPAVRVGRV